MPINLFKPRFAIIILIAVALVLTSAAWAGERTLHSFVEYLRGSTPQAGLVSDGSGHFYGTTASGGTYGRGTVFELIVSPSGSISQQVLYSFTGGSDGSVPMGSLVMDLSGNLYGTASQGGAAHCNECGTVFELLPQPDGTWSEKTLHTFSGSDGSNPLANLIFDSAGNLYGTTQAGGARQFGTAFELSPNGATWNLKVLHEFNGSGAGFYPECGLVFDQAGNLYGTTAGGGAFNRGLVFELTRGPNVWKELQLYSFNNKGGDGTQPVSGVVFDAAGNLYGATNSGGSNDGGIVYKLSLSAGTWTETILHNFVGGNDGLTPLAGVALDAAGNVYGTTQYGGGSTSCQGGCGTAYQLAFNSGTWSETILHSFQAGRDGAFPAGVPIIESDGSVWGTTEFSASGSYPFPRIGGTVFKLTPTFGSWAKAGYAFPATDGKTPQTGVIADAAGNLYGETYVGGDNGIGTVFELKRNGTKWHRILLYSFKGGIDGAFPYGGVIFDQAGNLFGTTREGGTGACSGNLVGCGTVFELTFLNGKWTERVIYSFQNSPDGWLPGSKLAIDAAGNLYGTTEKGGQFSDGTVFKLTPSGGNWSESVIYSFAGPDGADPQAGLVLDAAGNLYGTTFAGGNRNFGTVFELSPTGGTWTETRLYTFTGSGPDGNNPQHGLSLDQAGNVYGTTTLGGTNTVTCSLGCGVVFQLAAIAGGWTQTILHTFSDIPDGEIPTSPILIDSSGNLYGTTVGGGTFGLGTVYELTPGVGGTYTESILYNFTGGSDGASPGGTLVLNPLGYLYGTAAVGGVGQSGTVFSINPKL